MAVNALPLLHKYVLSPEDDKDLTLAKLRYRLCVKEVCEVLINRAQEKGYEPSQMTTTDDDSFHLNPVLKWEDSGIGTDESVSEDLRSPQHHDIFRINEEPSINDISRQPGSVNDETFHPEASPFLSSSSTSSDSCDESEEMGKPYLYSRNGENFDNGENNGDREFFENVYTEAKDDVAPVNISSCFENQVEDLPEEDEEMEEGVFVPVMSSTLDPRMDQSTDDKSPLDKNPPEDLTIQRQGDDSNSSPKGTNDKGCTDVDEALRILMTHKELPQIITRKAVTTWASWNAADLVRGPQRVQTEGKGQQQESQLKRNPSKQLQATHEKILSKDKKLADIYRKIQERDEEDQRMVKELLKKQTVPFAEPLPVALPPKPAPAPIKTSEPQVEKEVVVDAKPKEDSSARKTLTRAEEPASKKKKSGNMFQNVVHSIQRRFSKRGRGDATAS